VYYQAVRGASPIASGVDTFGISFTIAPVSVIVGATVAVTKRYRLQIWIGWCITIIGLGLLSTISQTTPRAASIGYQIIAGVGLGMCYAVSMFPVLAALPVTQNAYALSFYTFVRSLAQVWGVSIGATVLQNGLQSHLPSSFVNQFPGGASIAYAIIPEIAHLPQPLKDNVEKAFSSSLVTLWRILIAFAGAGLMTSIPMRALPLHTEMDSKWAAEEISPVKTKGLVGEKKSTSNNHDISVVGVGDPQA